jgi:hypothetical protein
VKNQKLNLQMREPMYLLPLQLSLRQRDGTRANALEKSKQYRRNAERDGEGKKKGWMLISEC